MLPHNELKSQNKEDTKNTLKAFRENADQGQRNENQTGVIFFKSP